METIWQQCLEHIRTDMTDISFNTWIRPIVPLMVQGDKFILQAPTDFIKNMLETRYFDLISNALDLVAPSQYMPVFITENERAKYQPHPSALRDAHPSQSGSAALNAKYTFDTFVTGNSNRFAHAASLAVAEAPAKSYNPLFIYGGSGLGKTHLMHAIGNYIISQNPMSKVLYVTSEKFTNELITSIQTRKNDEFRERYRNVDVLLVDDIQFIADKEQTQEEFFHTFNALHEANKQIVISSDKQPREIPTLEERLRSRFEWGLIADIQPPDFETRVAILIKKAESENIDICDDVIMYIASKIESNIRELEGSLTRVMAYAALTSREVNIELAEEALKDIFPKQKHKKISPQLIQSTVCEFFDISVEDMKAKKRTRELSYPRQIAMYITREKTDLSLPKIGELFGGRDHTTVIHAIEKISNDIKQDTNVRNIVNDLMKRLSE